MQFESFWKIQIEIIIVVYMLMVLLQVCGNVSLHLSFQRVINIVILYLSYI